MDKLTVEKNLLKQRSHLLNRMSASSEKIHQRKGGKKTDFSEQAMEIDSLDALFEIDNASRHELHKINTALNRLSHNEYNLCAYCGKTISEQRLLALPCTDSCSDCCSNDCA